MFEGIKGVNMQVLEQAQLGSQFAYPDSVRIVWLTSIVSKLMCKRMTRPRGCHVGFHIDRVDLFAVSFLV
jgi:hypothetical protein